MKSIKDFTVGDIIYITSKEEAITVCEKLHELGFKWSSGTPFSDRGEIDMFTWSRHSFIRPKVGTRGNLTLTRDFIEYKGYKISELKEFQKESKIINKANMKIFKKYNLENIKREVTICVLIDDGVVKAGYSVLHLSDVSNKQEGLSEKIAEGRAMKPSTNLVDMTMGTGMDKKYILYAIADNLAKQIDNRKINIKGVK